MEEYEIMFEKAGKPWSQQEDIQLNKLYNEDMLCILDISKIHKRLPGGIISRLINNNHIKNRKSVRGYIDYKQSDLYKQIVANNDIKREANKNNYIFGTQNDVEDIKSEIKEIKNTMKELVEMMKAVYDFEDE